MIPAEVDIDVIYARRHLIRGEGQHWKESVSLKNSL